MGLLDVNRSTFHPVSTLMMCKNEGGGLGVPFFVGVGGARGGSVREREADERREDVLTTRHAPHTTRHARHTTRHARHMTRHALHTARRAWQTAQRADVTQHITHGTQLSTLGTQLASAHYVWQMKQLTYNRLHLRNIRG